MSFFSQQCRSNLWKAAAEAFIPGAPTEAENTTKALEESREASLLNLIHGHQSTAL